MNWLETKIRRYEQRRWAQEPGRRVLLFAWGLEHIGGNASEPDARAFLTWACEWRIDCRVVIFWQE
jgi:hypothetical protein